MIVSFFNKYKDKIILISVYVVTFLSLIYPYSDKDWGWHYKYGEYLFTHGHLLLKDIYTWTMNGYLWVNHEWLFDPVIYLVFKYTGYFGAALAGTVVMFFCFYLLTKDHKLSYWKLAILAIFFINITESQANEGFRAQVLALIPLTLLIYLLVKAWQNVKHIYFIPPLMLLWVNMHGTFLYGLLIEAVFFAVYFFVFPKRRLLLIGVGLLSLIVTFFNPFKLNVYTEILKHTSSPYLQNVYEWMPITKNCNDCHTPTFFIYLALIALSFIEQPTAQNLPFLISAIILVVPTISYRRNLSIFIITTIPLLVSYLESLKFDLSKYKITPFVLMTALIILIEYNLFSRLPGFNFYKYNEENYCHYSSGCSVGITNYLLDSPPKGYGFNFYDEGGYLIGKNVPFSIFIDGRMHMWQTKDGYYPFADYIGIYYDNNIDKFNQYNFNWVIVPTDSSLATNIMNGGVQGDWVTGYRDQWQTYFIKK